MLQLKNGTYPISLFCQDLTYLQNALYRIYKKKNKKKESMKMWCKVGRGVSFFTSFWDAKSRFIKCANTPGRNAWFTALPALPANALPIILSIEHHFLRIDQMISQRHDQHSTRETFNGFV